MNADNDTLMNRLQRVRDDPEGVRAMLTARHFEAPLDRVLELDKQSRELRAKKELLQAERNKGSKGGPPSDAVKARMREVGEQIKEIDAKLGPLEKERDELALWIPNDIAADVPPGKDEHDNRVVREDPKHELAFPAKPHWGRGAPACADRVDDRPQGRRRLHRDLSAVRDAQGDPHRVSASTALRREPL